MASFGRIYTTLDDLRIRQQAVQMRSIAADMQNIVNNLMREKIRISQEWDSAGGASWSSKLDESIRSGQAIADEMLNISNALSAYAASHKSLLEMAAELLGQQ